MLIYDIRNFNYETLNLEKGQLKQHVIGLFTVCLTINCLLIPALLVLLFVFKCEFHMLAPCIPISCVTSGHNGKLEYIHFENPYYVIILGIIQYVIVNEAISSIFPYLAIGVKLIFEGREMIRSLMLAHIFLHEPI